MGKLTEVVIAKLWKQFLYQLISKFVENGHNSKY